MSDAVIVAIISGAFSLIVGIVSALEIQYACELYAVTRQIGVAVGKETQVTRIGHIAAVG